MSYDEHLADRIREGLGDRPDVSERKMFGGLAFMIAGKMAVGIIKEDLMVRVGPTAWERALAKPHVRVMDFTGWPMTGYVYVAPPGVATAAKLRGWIEQAVAFVRTLQPAQKR